MRAPASSSGRLGPGLLLLGAALLGAGTTLLSARHAWAAAVLMAGASLVTLGLWARVEGARASRARVADATDRAADGAARWRSLLDVPAAGCFVADRDDVIREASAPLHRMLGRAPGTLLGAAAGDVGLGATAEARHGVLEYGHPDGSTRLLELTTRALTEPDGSVVGHTTWVEDVTALVRNERALDEAQRRLLQSERLETLGTLAGGLAHDLNNVLTPIVGHVDLIRLDLPADSPLLEELDVVRSAAHRATDLTRRLMHLARPERDQVEPVLVQEVLHEAVTLLGPSRGVGVRIEEHLEPGCPPVLGTKTQLHQVLLNLCKNALQAMPDGGTLVVSADLAEALATMTARPAGDGPYVRIRITDTGTGMTEDTAAKIFDPFFTTKDAGRGSGLGLSMVDTIVKSLGGTITVDSRVGQGTTFTLLFPAHAPTGAAAAGTSPREPVRRPRPGGGDRAPLPEGAARAAPRILVVDDDAAVLDLTSRVLLRLGYEVSTHLHSPDALEAIRSDPEAFDLLLTDQMMPGLTGLELLAQAREVRPDLPAVLTTGRVDLIASHDLERLDCRLLPKPASALELDEVVSAGLGRPRAA